ncbi:sensor histidine kinase [Mucilaginibacter xinganensis]|uniref:Histidine kinase n=1 Tax=Mucilaginibacter xinganensis TaxID=1234841 RepID=A0A223NS70_9SPHI|nr:histidine kinase [Mucilaginibacter xinganensis]ASU32534.1 Histidine kinase [Mucilaginibacter xinganensis]
MRGIVIFLFFCFFQLCCQAQKPEMYLDGINPVIQHDSHGDSIRKYFSYTFFNYENSRSKNKKVLIAAFYSNKLAVNYRQALQKIPRLKQYGNPGSQSYIQLFNGYAGKYAIPIFDSSGIIITVNGINPQNVNQYQFRVIEDKQKVVLPWTRPTLFCKAYLMTKIADPDKTDEFSAYLGQFKTAYGKALTFQVRKLSTPDSIEASVTAYWVKWQPRVIGVFTFAQLPDFLSLFKKQWTSPLENPDQPDWSKDAALKLKKDFSYNENNLIFYLDDIIKSKSIIEYNLVNGKDSTGWTVNDFDFNLVWLKNLSPGNYRLKIRYSVQRNNIFTYAFALQAAWYQTVWAKAALSLLGILAAGFLLLLWRSGKQAEKLKEESTLKQLVQTELRSIRSQFNPHFVFNALSSIQGLITKNDSQKASKYLIEFSNLMRDSLKASDKEFVSIFTEIKILENYLALEKLRFGFSYQIKVSDEIDASALEIPALFLQPPVENAVKHGISALQENGQLVVLFEKLNNDMMVSVNDNGKGFNQNDNTGGFGLQLTKERIKLLNQTLNGQQIEFSVTRTDNLTHVIFHFKNWLI